MADDLTWYGPVAATVVVLAIAAAVAWLFVAGKNAAARDRSRTMAELRKMSERLFADLWSDETHRRLAALFVAQKMTRGDAEGLARVLIAFVRHRLAIDRGTDAAGFEDVRSALIILGSVEVRSAARRGRQIIDLSGVHFRAAPLSGIDFHGLRLARCDFSGCQLSRANFAGCELASASFAGANLREANLQKADISNADMSNADLSRARLTGAKTASTNFGGSILIGTIGLDQEQLDAAFGDAGTALPEDLRIAAMRSRRPLQMEVSVR